MNQVNTNWKLVLPMLIGMWALVGINRMALAFLGPFIIEEFALTKLELGLAVGIVAFTWASGSLFAGFLSDRFGTKPIIVIAGLLSGLFGWCSGLAGSFVQLVGIRGALGLGEGALWAPMVAASSRMVPPKMKAKVVGLFTVAFILLGVVFGLPLLTKLGSEYGWRNGFFIVSAPLLLISLMVWFFMKEPPIEGAPEVKTPLKEAILGVFKHRNIYACAGIGICIMARLFLILTFGVLFLNEIHGVKIEEGGVVAPAILAEVVGIIFFGAVADKMGKRKALMVPAFILSIIGIMAFALLPVGTPIAVLIGCLAFAFFFGGGVAPLALGVIPEETVKPVYAASAIGITNFISEFVGGGVFPIIGGGLGDSYGLKAIMLLAAILMSLAFVFALLLKETKAVRQKG